MSSRRGKVLALSVALAASLAPAAPAYAQGVVGEGAARLESGVDELTGVVRRFLEDVPLLGEPLQRIRISGSARGAYLDAQDDAQLPRERWLLWDARVFVDAVLAENLALGGRPLLHAAGLSFEWEFYRVGRKSNDLGHLTLDLQGVLGSSWANLSLGRFHVPVGEAYLRYGKGEADRPFVTHAVGAAWWWDEGVKLWGTAPSGRFGYVASLTEGGTPRDWSPDGLDQVTLKLFANPTRWLHLSVSALRVGESGDDESPANTALWLGEGWARAFGTGSGVANLVDGAVVPDGPGTLRSALYLAGDVVLTHPGGARLWLSYGSYDIDSRGPGLYDRRLHTWIAELQLEGRLASPELRPFYVAARAAGVGTYDGDEGYLLDVRYGGRLGWNMRSLEAYSLALGWRLTRWTDVKLEYTFQDVDVVAGAEPRGMRADDADFLLLSLGVRF